MKWALVSISLLSLFLLLAIFYVYKQMKKVAAARREVIDANKRLKELNDELHLSNAQLKEANHSIAENSYLKEEYIGRYMDQCSVYLEKMDNYRRSLGKIAATGNVPVPTCGITIGNTIAVSRKSNTSGIIPISAPLTNAAPYFALI